MSDYHTSILAKEVLEFAPDSGIIIDATLGGGGHSEMIFKKLKSGKLISIDRDKDAIDHVVNKYGLHAKGDHYSLVEGEKEWLVMKSDFDRVGNILNEFQIEKVDFILADLGVSSHQIDEKTRGFSFMEKGPLDMRMNQEQQLTARDLVNGLNQKELVKIFKDYGEERYADEIANAIVRARSTKEIKNTVDIVEIIRRTVGEKYESKNPAMRVFQALRIAVNDELGELERFLDQVAKKCIGSTIFILTFHSLERNIVEKYVSENEKVYPTDQEVRANSRSKSCIGMKGMIA